jgi:hypothetical protein
MLSILFRFASLLFGVVVLVEAWLPLRTEQLQVDRHTTNATHQSVGTSTDYTIHLIGGLAGSCSVGYNTYTSLRDGDHIEVDSTRFLKKCTRISRGAEVFEAGGHWRLFETIFALLLLGFAFGWLRSDDDERGVRLTLRL